VVLDLVKVAILGLELLRQGPLVDSIGVELLIILRGDKRLQIEPAANINAVDLQNLATVPWGSTRQRLDSPSNTINTVLELLIERRGEALRPGRVVGRVCGVKHPIATKLIAVCKLVTILHLNQRSVIAPSDKVVRFCAAVAGGGSVACTIIGLGPEDGKVQKEPDGNSDEQQDDGRDENECNAFLALLPGRGVRPVFLRQVRAYRAHFAHGEARGG